MENSKHLDIQEVRQIIVDLDAGNPLPLTPESLADQIAEAYINSTGNNQDGENTYLELLCKLALSDNSTTSSAAVTTLYRSIIEGFCDDFTVSGTDRANRALANLILYGSRESSNNTMQQRLTEIGLSTESAILDRWHQIATAQSITDDEKGNIRKVILPSRVSAGADIVITSVMIYRLLSSFPNVEIDLIGPEHLQEIFFNIPRLNIHIFDVKRHGSLSDRIMSWPRLEKCVRDISAGLADNEVIIFDPDSRLSQLGLLPLNPNFKTCHFPSRSMPPQGENGSLSEITNQWLNILIGPDKNVSPRISLPDNKVEAASSFLDLLRKNGCQKIIIANFGVGGDERKEMPFPFEERVLNQILAHNKCIIILDMGCGSEEKNRTEKLIAKASHSGVATALINETQMAGFNPGFDHGIVGACTSLGSLAALISGADCYLGYDSSGQHLATALSTPSVTVFAGYQNARFLERWSPVATKHGNSVIPVPGPVPKFLVAIDELAEKTVTAVNLYL